MTECTGWHGSVLVLQPQVERDEAQHFSAFFNLKQTNNTG